MCNCNSCNNPCQTVGCVECLKGCNNCEDSYSSECVFLNVPISCSTDINKLNLTSGLSLNEVFKILICKINHLEDRIDYLQSNPNGSCDIIQITNLG